MDLISARAKHNLPELLCRVKSHSGRRWSNRAVTIAVDTFLLFHLRVCFSFNTPPLVRRHGFDTLCLKDVCLETSKEASNLRRESFCLVNTHLHDGYSRRTRYFKLAGSQTVWQDLPMICRDGDKQHGFLTTERRFGGTEARRHVDNTTMQTFSLQART